jgi:hypothetical protein
MNRRGVSDGRQLGGLLLSPERSATDVVFLESPRALFLGMVGASLELPPYHGVLMPPQEYDVGDRMIVLPPRLK